MELAFTCDFRGFFYNLCGYWSFDKAKTQKLISAYMREMHKTVDFHSNLLVSWELVTEGYQGRPMKCTHFK